MPDLIPLPAWGMGIDRQGGRDYLDFGATVWDAGPAPMDVEGFRRPGTNIMDAFQYFFRNGKPVGRAKAGTLEYDSRPGHEHWHFLQFARYSLLSASKSQVVRSEKEGFCLAPTDAIDLTVPGALWDPFSIGLEGQCGDANSIWTRETLPAGWGDTYFQFLPGQSFDITDLKNGTYYVEVRANPLGAIHETSTTNDVRLRKVILGGKPGARTVHVPGMERHRPGVTLEVRPFGEEDLAAAAVLLADRHRRHRAAEPLLPAAYEEPDAAGAEIEALWRGDGDDGRRRGSATDGSSATCSARPGTSRSGGRTAGSSRRATPPPRRRTSATSTPPSPRRGWTRGAPGTSRSSPRAMRRSSTPGFGCRSASSRPTPSARWTPAPAGRPGCAGRARATSTHWSSWSRVLPAAQDRAPAFAFRLAPDDPDEVRADIEQEVANPDVGLLVAEAEGRIVGSFLVCPVEMSSSVRGPLPAPGRLLSGVGGDAAGGPGDRRRPRAHAGGGRLGARGGLPGHDDRLAGRQPARLAVLASARLSPGVPPAQPLDPVRSPADVDQRDDLAGRRARLLRVLRGRASGCAEARFQVRPDGGPSAAREPSRP